MKIITTDVAVGRYFDDTAAMWTVDPDREGGLIAIYPEKQHHAVLGFGGALSLATVYA